MRLPLTTASSDAWTLLGLFTLAVVTRRQRLKVWKQQLVFKCIDASPGLWIGEVGNNAV